jgi:predicted nucleic acid-binding protein
MADAIIDACCFINLYATDDIRGFLTASGWDWHIPRAVLAESLYVRTRGADGKESRERVEANPYIAENLIRVVEVEKGEEVNLYVQLASELDDGEAMALAIARVRSWVLATDDRKARRFATDLGVQVVGTPELIKQWAMAANILPSTIKALLANVEFGARFVPPESAPGYEWWVAHAG